MEQLSKFSQEKIMSDDWYEETFLNVEDYEKKEQFPYLLVDYKSKWGSGLESMIYVEGDGKGILISTADQQYYYRSEMSTLKEVDDSE
ncbi:hypothetical protein [Paraliobacillus sediminis]|uniref:hypothetical protein n=1 Tax=Paraliobacillus sediminis TaxID=1885916 RepID=UPI001F074702|nr:hypothetical protein [Paraliobacillus sediminis]